MQSVRTPGPEATLMFREARQAPQAVARQLTVNAPIMLRLGARLRALAPRAVVTIGRGSSDHAATFAKYLIETRLGVVTSSGAPSVSSLYASAPGMAGSVCLAISQSGRSPDLLSAVASAKSAGALVIAMVNTEGSPLSALADETIALGAGPELSVAATKSYITALSAIAQLTTAWAEDEDLAQGLETLPRDLAAAWELDWSAALDHLGPASNLYVIARGLGFTIAQEAALKFKETCGLHAEAFSAAEVRHGPMALVVKGFPVLAFAQDDESRAGVDAVATEFAALGADVMLAGTATAAAGVVRLPSLSAHPALQPLLHAQSFYRLVNRLALERGHDPDHPPTLNKVTETL